MRRGRGKAKKRMSNKDKGNFDEKKSAKGQVAAGAPAAMEGKQKKAKAHKDKRGRGTK